MIRDSKDNGEANDALRARLLDVDDGLSRLASLCHLGALAAEGMHGLDENPDATALSAYFSLLGREIEGLRRRCSGAGESP